MTAIVYDTELRRPACVILQAAAGGDRDVLLRNFEPEDWLTAPTPGMKLLECTEDQVAALVIITERARDARD